MMLFGHRNDSKRKREECLTTLLYSTLPPFQVLVTVVTNVMTHTGVNKIRATQAYLSYGRDTTPE